MSYNGWKNWDTWECYLILSNDEGGLAEAMDMAQDQDRKDIETWLGDYVRQANWDYCDSICWNDVDVDEIIATLKEDQKELTE